MNIRPLRDNLVVRPFALERTTPGGIVLPEQITPKNFMNDDIEKPYFTSHCLTGEAIAVGPGKIGKNGKTQPLEVAVGDKIQFSMNGLKKIPDSDCVMIQEASVVGFVE